MNMAQINEAITRFREKRTPPCKIVGKSPSILPYDERSFINPYQITPLLEFRERGGREGWGNKIRPP